MEESEYSETKRLLVRIGLIAFALMFVLGLLLFTFRVIGMDKYSYCSAWVNITPQDCDLVWSEFNQAHNFTYGGVAGNSTVIVYTTINNSYSKRSDDDVLSVVQPKIDEVKELCVKIQNEYLEEQVAYYKADNSWLRNGSKVNLDVNVSFPIDAVSMSVFNEHVLSEDARISGIERTKVTPVKKSSDNSWLFLVLIGGVVLLFVWKNFKKKEVVPVTGQPSGDLGDLLKYVKEHPPQQPQSIPVVAPVQQPVVQQSKMNVPPSYTQQVNK